MIYDERLGPRPLNNNNKCRQAAALEINAQQIAYAGAFAMKIIIKYLIDMPGHGAYEQPECGQSVHEY